MRYFIECDNVYMEIEYGAVVLNGNLVTFTNPGIVNDLRIEEKCDYKIVSVCGDKTLVKPIIEE